MFRTKLLSLLAALLALVCCVSACAEPLDYSDASMWAYDGSGEEYQPVDVFFISPASIKGSETQLSADVFNDEDREAMLKGIGMQSQLYNQSARFIAPHYRQATMYCPMLSEAERKPYNDIAEEDVKAAFAYYMEHMNNGRPFVLASFSLGADMGLRLMKAYADDEAFWDKLVAAYLIGWRVTDEDLRECPALKMAQGESDTGVIITFDCEAEYINDTYIVPEGVFTYSINPLNWKTDSTPATKEENLGYVYPDKDGNVKQEIPNLCGAYIDPVRGTLKVPDVTAEDFPSRTVFLPEGAYHIYDYEFFYRNLQKNVQTRINAYLANK